jgi:hypothetical protein
VCAVLVLGGVGAANACWPADRVDANSPPPITAKQFERANSVFVARVVRTEVMPIEETHVVFGGKEHPVVEATFQTIEVLKGRPPDDNKVRSLVHGFGNCTIMLLAGMDYVFFLRPDVLMDEGRNLVWWTTGSFGTFNIEGTEPKGILDELRKRSKSTK